MPEVFAQPLEAEQGMIEGTATFDRVVTDLRLLLFAIDNEHGRVDIEDQPRGPVWRHAHPMKKAIMQRPQLRQSGGCHAQQKSVELRRVGIAGQASQVLKHPILQPQMCRFDPFETKGQWVEQGQQHLANVVPIVPLSHPNLGGQRVVEPNRDKKRCRR